MKHIGIITYHRSQNYGAQLQAYATRTALEQMGHQAEVIDCNRIGEEKKLFHWNFRDMRGFLGAFRNNILSLVCEKKRWRKFAEFSERHIGLSAPCPTRADLESRCARYDTVITGSDQVWHPQICEGDTAFFLDLPLRSEQKIAYAPSFGVAEYSEEEAQRYMPFIQDIGHLSVREEAGQRLIRKHLNREAPLVLDPTMLLTKEDWNPLATPAPYKRYLLYFTILDEPPGLDAMVRRIAAERRLSIVRIGSLKDLLKPGFINARANGPQEFLGLVRDAELVVTTSFHGTVFSILFEKDFLSVLNNNNRNSRLETLAEQLGTESQLVRDVSAFTSVAKPDYHHIRARLAARREESLQFLRDALS